MTAEIRPHLRNAAMRPAILATMQLVLLAATAATPSLPDDSSSISRAVILFLVVAGGLAILFVGVLLLTRARRLRREATSEDSATANVKPLADPWQAAGDRIEVRKE
jgi:hypothetical protein